MYTVHIYQSFGRVSTQAMSIPFDALLEHIGIPPAGPIFSAEDQLD